MRALFQKTSTLIPMAVAGLLIVVAAAHGVGRPDESVQAAAPSRWLPLESDGAGDCGANEAGRDVTEAYYAAEGGYLHLRLCTAGTPGWEPVGGGWTDARYKWNIDSGAGRFLVLVEDADLGSNDQGGAVVSDGRGEVTFLDDPNRNGRFADDWATRNPPEYLNNALGSRLWRRAVSGATGPMQASSRGSTSEVGFRLGTAACGPTVDVYVRLALVGSPNDVCLSWATDAEGNGLDARPGCDSGGPPRCVPLSGASPTAHVPPSATPGPIVPTPTATDTAKPVVPTSTPTPTATDKPTATSVPPSETPVPPLDTPVPPATAAPTETAVSPTETTVPPTDTPKLPTASPTATPTGAVVPATATANIVPSATPTASPTAPGHVLTPTPTATGTAALPVPTGTVPAGTPSAIVCVHRVDGGQSLPFPDPATVHAVLLTPWGWPAKPVESRAIGPDSCARYYGLEPGQYRVWVSVPSGWQPYPGTPSSLTMWITAGQPAPSQCVFRYVFVGAGPGAIPSPPGPPPLTPPPGGSTPPGPPGPILPTPTPTSAFPLPPGPPTAYPPSPDRPAVGSQVQLPVLGYLGNDAVCSAWVEAQNIGDRPAKALMLLWGEPGFCPPQCAGPLKVECSGLLAPGTAWNFLGGQMPRGAKSGLVISANADPWGNDIFADALCEALYRQVVGDCDEYRRFRKAYDERRVWNGFDFGFAPSQPLAVEVLRDCPGDVRPNLRVTSSYAGVAGEFLGHWDPVYGGYAFFAPSLMAGFGGYTSVLYIQNAGLECTSVELWFKSFEDCLRPRICDILTLAPGESAQFDASSCMPSGWAGSAWIRWRTAR
jgi:hypothetical protein